jgi:ATP-dependent RNA helicase DDX10/DBP4
LRARAKKGKLRIKTGGHGGNERTVFGEDGEAMAPLEALGDRNAGPVPEGGEALAAATKAHYDRVKKQRLEADVADRAREKQRLRDMRDKNKAKARKLAGDDEGAGVAVLGGGSDDDDASSDSGGSGRDSGGSDDSDSDSDSDSSDRPKRKRAKTDVSVAGMALKSETVESMEERAMRLLEGK